MKKLLTLFLLCISFASPGQNKKLDSLYNVLANHPQEDTTRANTIFAICYHEYTSNPEKNKALAEEALRISRNIHFTRGIGFAIRYISLYHWIKGDYGQAAKYAFEMLAVFEGTPHDKGLSQAYGLLGLIHEEWDDFDKSELYYKKALEINEKAGRKYDMAYNYNSLGSLNHGFSKYDQATEYYLKSLALREQIKDEDGMSQSYNNLAHIFKIKNDYPKAIEFFEKALPIARKFNNRNRISIVSMGLGEMYLLAGKYNQAEPYLLESLSLAKKLNNKKRLRETYRKLTVLENKRGNYKSALEYLEFEFKYQDSLYTEDKARQIAEVETKYETAKKEQTINLLEQENKIKSLSRNLLLAGLTSVVLLAGLIFYFQRQKNRRNQGLLKKQEELNQKLQEADKLKSRFFANISHEFRTPLTLILSPVEEKLLAEDLTQKDKISFQSIRRSANRLLELINQLLELSRLESGFMKLRAQPGNLYSFIMPILSSFDSMADVGQVKYTKEIRIPESVVLFDDDKLEKILNNLLSNAFKFSPKAGRVEVRVIAGEREKSVELTIEIKNTSFISPDTLDKIFELFFQGENTLAQGVPGTGLGLSLVKELVKLHGGDVHVTSTSGEGTVFTVTLSFEKSDMPATVHATEKTETIVFAEEPSGNKPTETDDTKETILIVEDNQDVRNLIRQGLQAHYNILEASTGKEGVDIACNQNIDLVVSDVMMPVMNGIELCHLLKNDELTSHIPIILLTARADHESKLEGLRTGADDYVVKPFNMQELQARIVNLTEQRKKLIRKYNQHIVVQPHEITVTPLDERFIQKAIQVVEENLDNADLSVDKMSEVLGMSRTNLHRKLKSVTGLATGEFIQDFRLRRAAQLIEKKADTISQIAYQVGFNDQSYFTKCFKKKFGKTPSEFAAGNE